MAEKTKTIIASLIAVVVVLAALVVYSFVVRPSITGYAINRQFEGYNFAYEEILSVVTQCQAFPIRLGEGEDEVINLVALECLEAPQEQGMMPEVD